MAMLNISISGGTAEPMNINLGMEITPQEATDLQTIVSTLLNQRITAATSPGTDLTTTE